MSINLAYQIFSIGSLWHPFSFSFSVGSFFLLRITLNPNCVLKSQDNLHLFSTSPSFRMEDLGIDISTLYPNHQIWYLSIEKTLRKNSLRISWKYVYQSFAYDPYCFLFQFHCNFIVISFSILDKRLWTNSRN